MFVGSSLREASPKVEAICPSRTVTTRLAGVALALALAGACHSPDPATAKADAIGRGDAFLRKQQYSQAISAYQVAAKADPKDGEVRLKLADAYRRAERWSEATLEAIGAADLLPDNKDAQVQAVEASVVIGRFVDAIDRVRPILQKTPDDPRALVLFANATAHLRYSTLALAQIEEALRQGRDIEAVRVDVRPLTALADDKVAETAFRRALQLAPDMTDARLGLAGFLWATGRFDEGSDVLRQAADADPNYSFVNRALGLFYASRGRDPEAEKYLKVAASTGDRDSQFVLADYYLQRHRGADALPMLEKMAAGDDPDGGAALRTADIEFAIGKPAQAMQRVDKILARDPRNARALRIKAQVLFAAKDYSQATKVATAAAAADPRSEDARLVLARSLVATGDPERAFDAFAEAWRLNTSDAGTAKEMAGLALTLGRDQVALEFARESVRLNRTDRAALLILVRALIRQRDFTAANQTLAPLVANQAASPDALVLLAAIQAGRGNTDAARTAYLSVLQADRDSLDALSGLVALEIQAHQAARVRPRVDQAVAAHPKDPAYLLLAAQISQAEGDASHVESILRKILDIDPGQVQANLLLADVLTHQNRRDEATRVIQQGLARRPSSFDLQVSMANLLDETGHVAEARARYEDILAANTQASAVSSRLAALYADQGSNLDKALDLAKTAKQQLPNDSNVSDTLGWVYVRKDLPSLGLPYLEDAVRAQPGRALFRYHLGVAHQQRGEFAQARDEIARALALDPNFRGASDARAVLDTLGR
jgi:tetratricopeptide (TPR) repeat protein